ncbi:hypothetical protein L0337_42200 [candidate division KSB1 bacterium]|nr:hypothetical protein [candidate division KSB1 bacterium]
MLKRNDFFQASFLRNKQQKFFPTDRNNATDKVLSVALFLSVGLCFFLLLVDVAQSAPASAVKIVSLSGEVKVRRGVEETWHPAAPGTSLEEIDTILTGEASAVVLETPDGATFRLSSYAILDIADLRKITEREMFLYLMSNKVNQIPTRQEKTRLRIGNVSTVHGEPKAGSSHRAAEKDESQSWIQETNGAKALYEQRYYPNAVVKLHKILAKYPNLEDCGEIHFYLGKAFEALGKPGQARDAYKTVLERLCDNDVSKQRADEARQSIERLK